MTNETFQSARGKGTIKCGETFISPIKARIATCLSSYLVGGFNQAARLLLLLLLLFVGRQLRGRVINCHDLVSCKYTKEERENKAHE